MKYKERVCDFCGERLKANDTFCKSCGHVTTKDKDAPDAIIEDPNGNSNINMNLNSNLLLVVFGLLAVIIVILLFL